jgi:TetR/AcrR family transcriptional repressor of nem operon
VKKECETKHKILDTALELMWTQNYGSVSVDDICEQAGVRKGSFYHFFPSKSDLAVAAFEKHWESSRLVLDQIFSAQNPPLERLSRYCDLIESSQSERRSICGMVCGCPYASVGSELCSQDEKIRQKSKQMSERYCCYIEASLRDAAGAGLITLTDPPAMASQVFCYIMGILQQAKIQNDLSLLKRLKCGVLKLIGARECLAA